MTEARGCHFIWGVWGRVNVNVTNKESPEGEGASHTHLWGNSLSTPEEPGQGPGNGGGPVLLQSIKQASEAQNRVSRRGGQEEAVTDRGGLRDRGKDFALALTQLTANSPEPRGGSQ